MNREMLDLTDQQATENWLERMRPDAIFLAARLVGGIHANNTYPADFISNNLAISLNVIRGAHAIGVKKLLALGSSCIYPKYAAQPMSEELLLTGPLEPTNEWLPSPRLQRSSYVRRIVSSTVIKNFMSRTPNAPAAGANLWTDHTRGRLVEFVTYCSPNPDQSAC